MEAQTLHDINEISAILVRTPGKPGDLTSLLQHIAQTAQKSFAADACVILAFNPITGRFISSQATVGDSHAKNESLHDKPRPNGVTQQVLRDGEVFIEDLEFKPQYHNRFTRKEAILAFASLALRTRHRKRPLGVIYLDYRQPKKFSSTDYERLRIFAVQASFLLQETWLAHHYEEVARIGQEINHNLATEDDLFQVLQTYVDTVLDDSHTLLLSIYQAQTKTLDIYVREHGRSFCVSGPLQGAFQHVIETQELWFIQQFSKQAEQLPFQIVNITGTEEKESCIFVPLMLRGATLGVLSIQHPLPNAYGQEDQFILQLLASYIALALHNMRLYTSLSQLNETGQLLTQQLESEQTLQATVDKIQEATKADAVILYAYEPAHQRFVVPPRIAGKLLDSTIQSRYPSRPDDIASLMLHRKDPIFAKESAILYTELQGDVHIRQGDFQERENIRSTAAIPLQVGEEVVGVLFVNFRQPQRFDATLKLFIEGLAHYAAIAIKNAQVFGTLIQRRVRELQILRNIDLELNRSLDLESVLNTLLRLANEQVHAEEAGILLRNTRTQVLEIPAAIGLHAEARREHIISLHEAKGITRWVWEHKKPARVGNVLRDPQWRDLYIPSGADTISELDVPLLDGEGVVGVINFESTREDAFRQEDEDFLLTLAGQAVLAIKNAQAYEREKRLAEEGRVLNQISKEITSQLDYVRIFDLILEKALDLTHSHMGNLMLYDADQNDLWMAAEHGVAEEKKSLRQKQDQGIVGYVAHHKQLQNVGDVTQHPWNEIYLELFPGARSELAVPMLAGNELRGVLNVESISPSNFNESDERLLQGLADLAVVALQNAQAYEREKRFAQESQVLNEISKEITSQLDHVRVFKLILDKALELTHSTLGSLHLYNAEADELRMMVEYGVAEEKKGLRQKLGKGIVGYAAERKQLLNVKDVTQPPWKEIYVEFFPGARSELAVPMLEGTELRGVLNIESPTYNNFTDHDERLLQGLADLAVVALQNAERYEKAEREAQHFELLYQAGQELSKITDLSQLEQAYNIVVQLAEMQSESQVVIYRSGEENAELVLVYASHRKAPLFERISIEEGLNGQAAREHRRLVVHDIDHLPPDVISVKQSDPTMHSLVVTPILFKDQYYGNLGLRHEKVGHFRDTDIDFFEALAQQLASTIHRLETVQERKEFEQRAVSAEEMSSIGQSAYEVTHRLGNDLGLVESYVGDIQSELESLGIDSKFVSRKLENIVQAVRTVLDLSRELKHQLASLGATDEAASEPIMISPRLLLEGMRAHTAPSLPPNIQIYTKIDTDVAYIQAIPGSIDEVLRNLIANAIQAMPKGGQITLRARNVGRYVALEVADTGIGMPPEKQSKIFDLFFSTKGSSGFGLWSARRNILKNRGEIKVESKPDQGTTFILLLPRINGEIREYYEAMLQQPTNPGN